MKLTIKQITITTLKEHDAVLKALQKSVMKTLGIKSIRDLNNLIEVLTPLSKKDRRRLELNEAARRIK